ncbi:hypothetical protein EV421DRAFT_1721887, partial [Armillaria borealis]
TAKETSLSKDLYDWKNRMNDSGCRFISQVLTFFAASDGVVNENLIENISKKAQLAEAL